MIDLLQSLKSLLQCETVHTDNNIFKLHYKLTVVMLAGFSVLLTSKQYFGDPIDCDVETKKETIDTYCWIYGTFINKLTLTDKRVPGLGNENSELNLMTKQVYYQWVCLCFGLQALFSTYQDTCGQLGKAESYDYSLAIWILQIYFMDWLISGNFSKYGLRHASYKLVNPMDSVFPKVSKCTYFNYGPSGSIQSRDALCVLPLNILNEKLFLALWYWLFFLLLLSSIALLHRALFLFVPLFRVYLLRAQVRKLEGARAHRIVDNLSFGDFFLLYRIGKNVNPIMYRDLVLEVYDNLGSKKSDKSYLPRLDSV